MEDDMEQRKTALLDGGRIVNTHGIRGEVKIVPWCDSAAFLAQYRTFYIAGEPLEAESARVHKETLLVKFKGVNDVNDAMRLKNKVVQIDKNEVPLPEGTYFIDDLVGLTVLDADTGAEVGRIAEILTLPANDVYVVRGEREYMIPAVPAFVVSKDVPGGTVTVKMQEGLATDAD